MRLDSIIALLLTDAKASQGRDIRRAQEFWRDYLEAKRNHSRNDNR
jgi:hypothetical protein